MNPKTLLIVGCILSSTSATIDHGPSTDRVPIDPAGSVMEARTSALWNRDLSGSSARPEHAPTTSSHSWTKNFAGDSTLSASIDYHLAPESDKVDDTPGHLHPDIGPSTRNKRTLTFPDPSTILLIFGIGTPLQLDRESIIVGAFTKMIYNLPLNSTDFTEPGVHFARTKSRWSVYKLLERAAQVYGLGGGKGCLLRAICEVAAAPFDLHHGLFGEIAQAFLTPSSTSEAYDEYGDREYHAAERLGWNAGENCHALHTECRRSFLDVFSITRGRFQDDTANKPRRR